MGTDLSNQVEALYSWKQHLLQQVTRYQSWLKENELYSDDLDKQLQRGFSLLKQNELKLAFVGEYSRGKTELINALVFAGFGKRMLPSQAGRTTMCPTELFYDAIRKQNYLRLLPIESRLENCSIDELKCNQSAWQEIVLTPEEPEKMAAELAEVAATISVSFERAHSLGFDESHLDQDSENPGHVIIPKWRHAIISLNNPLLEKGLCILDTPGLNALGSEPELTISMIPNANAVVFMLSADAGVTASDMTIWREYIAQDNCDHQAGRFAVLNKIDVLWDDIEGSDHTQKSIERIRQLTASQLGIATGDVIPLSAKQGLMARVQNNTEGLQRSALPQLEKLISQRLLQKSENDISQSLVREICEMLHNSQSNLKERLQKLEERVEAYRNDALDTKVLQGLNQRTQDDYQQYQKRLITLRSSRRLMESQGKILQGMISTERFDKLVRKTRQQLQDSWSTLGMNRAMAAFFSQLEHDVNNLVTESQFADKMVNALYQRYSNKAKPYQLKPKSFDIEAQRAQLKSLKHRAARFRRNPKVIMTEQTLLIRRFFNTFVAEAKNIQRDIRKETIRWPEEALLPVIQYTLEQKKLIARQIARMKEINEHDRTARAQQQQVMQLMKECHEQLQRAAEIQHNLRQPTPLQQVVIEQIKKAATSR